MSQLLDIHITEANLTDQNRGTYRGYVRKHVHPFLCQYGINDSVFDAELFDSFYAELGRCREHCRPGHKVDHYTDKAHRCAARCRPHGCVPLKDATIRKIHFILKGGFDLAFRRQWIVFNPIVFAQAPQPASGNPDPPTVHDATILVDAAWTKVYYLAAVPRRLLQRPRHGTRRGRETFLANALGHAAVRRKYTVHTERADKLFKRLKAARLDHTYDEEMRKLHRVEQLILDDLSERHDGDNPS